MGKTPEIKEEKVRRTKGKGGNQLLKTVQKSLGAVKGGTLQIHRVGKKKGVESLGLLNRSKQKGGGSDDW